MLPVIAFLLAGSPPTAQQEDLVVPLTVFGGVTTTQQWSGLIDVHLTGIGFSTPGGRTDGFYKLSLEDPPVPISSETQGLRLSFTGCAANVECGAPRIDDFIVTIDGVGAVEPPAKPPYSPDGYSFTIDVGPVPKHLTFGEGDGGVHDNWGEFRIELRGVSQDLCNPRDYLKLAPFSGWALHFDGVGDHVRVDPTDALRVTDALTIEAWILPTGPGSSTEGGIIVNKEGEYELARFADGTIRWGLAVNDPRWLWISSGFVAEAFEWTHVAMVYADGTVRTFANGMLVSTHSMTGSIGDLFPDMNELRIGGRQGPWPQDFSGVIDEVRVWHVARRSEQIMANMHTELPLEAPGLIGYWRLDEGAGETAAGSVDGTVVGAAWVAVERDVNENGVPDDCEQRFIRGDCNADAAIDLSDALFLLGSIFVNTGNPPCDAACDTNYDGTLDVSDPVYVLLALFGGGAPLPAPWPDCGVDLKPSLGCASFPPCE